MPNYVRIGTLSSLAGITADTLRAWERRYRLFSPARTSGRFRLYDEEDVERAREMAKLISSGVAASEAARRVLTQATVAEVVTSGGPPLAAAADSLRAAVRTFDEAAIERAVDRLLAIADLDTVMRDVFLPVLVEIGQDWAAGTLTVAQEHFSVSLLRARLMGLARGWDMGVGPQALLACPEGEDHDISLVMFGIALHRRGWRVVFLGANTPLADLADTQRRLSPRVTVLFSVNWNARRSLVPVLSAAAARRPLFLAGGMAKEIAEESHCRWLAGDPVSAADEVTGEAAEPLPSAVQGRAKRQTTRAKVVQGAKGPP